MGDASALTEKAQEIAAETELVVADPQRVKTPFGSRKLTVQEAVALVVGDLPNIGKANKSPEGYAYRGIEAVTKHVQPLFAKYGVVIAPRARITDVRPSPAMKDGWQDVYMEVAWTITGPDGSWIEAQTTGIGRDRSDKGANKAQTQAFKYLLLHLLCIADGKDDTDNQTYEHDRAPEIVWNKNTVKQNLRDLLDGDAEKAKTVWSEAGGDQLAAFDADTAAHMLAGWEAQQEAT